MWKINQGLGRAGVGWETRRDGSGAPERGFWDAGPERKTHLEEEDHESGGRASPPGPDGSRQPGLFLGSKMGLLSSSRKVLSAYIYMPRSGTADHTVVLYSVFWGTSILFSIWYHLYLESNILHKWTFSTEKNSSYMNEFFIHGLGEQTCGCRGGGGASGMAWGSGVHRCKRLPLVWVSNEILLCSTGNCI